MMMRRLSYLIFIFTLIVPAAMLAQVKPNNFPFETAPDSSNFEVYSQKNNQVKRANLFALKKYFAPYIQAIGYVPASTGNTTHLTEVVYAPNGNVYYIDGKGKSTQLFGTQAIHHDATMTGDGSSGSPLSVVAADDDQTISSLKSGSNVTILIEDGNTTTFSVDDADANSTNEIQILSKDDNTNLVTLSKSGGSFIDEVDDADHDTLNELQILSYDPVTDSLGLSDGNKVYLGDLGSDNQTLSIVSDSLKILRGNAIHRSLFDKQKLHVRSKSHNNLTLGIDYGDDIILNVADEDSSYINEIQDLVFNPANDSLHIQYANTVYLGSLVKDSSPTNEAQTISKTGSTVTLTSVSGVGGGSFTDEVNDADANPTNEAQTITKTGSTVTLTSVSGIGGGTFADSDNQALSVNGNQLTISGGNTVTLNPNDADANPSNEIQYLGLNGNVLSITNGNYVTLPAVSSGGTGADNWGTQYVVTDNTLTGSGLVSDSLRVNTANSIFADQNISKDDVTNIVTLDKDGGSFTDEVDDADHDPVNEAQTISKSGSTVTLTSVSGSGGGSFTDEVDDADHDPVNEAQTISKSGSTVTLTSVSGSGGGSFTDSDVQTLSLSGSDLSILGGNTVTLPLGSGGDNWGTQVVQHDATLSGSGTASSNLTVSASAQSKWTTSSNDIYNNNSANVGIGSATPQRKLEVSFNNSANTNLPLRLTNTATSGTNYTGLEAYTGGIKSFDLLGNAGDVRLRVADNVPLVFYTNNTDRGRFLSTGDFQLVNKLITPSLQVTTSASAGKVLTSDASGNATWQTSAAADNWGTQTVVTGSGLSGQGTSGSPLVATDASATNEAQTLSLAGSTLSLTAVSGVGGGSVSLPSGITGSGTNRYVTFWNGTNAITGSQYLKFDTDTILQAGKNVTTSGSVLLKGDYYGNKSSIVFTEYGSGAIGLGTYMYQDGSATWRSSFPFGSTQRSALIMNPLSFLYAPSQNVAAGSFLTTQPTVILAYNSSYNRFEFASKIYTPSLQVTTGASAGKVLTSDASGNATWETATGADNWGTQVVQTNGGLSGSGTVASPLVATDASATNEAQTLSKVGGTITLSSVSGSGGGSVSDTDTDDQTLTFTSSTDNLAISEGNSVSLSKYLRKYMFATNSTSHSLSTSLAVIPFNNATGTTSYFTFNNTDDSITPSEAGTYRFQFIANLNDTSSGEDVAEFGFYGTGGLIGLIYNNYPRFIANPTKTYINYEWIQYLESGEAFQVKGDGTNMNLSANYTFLIEKISN